MNYHVTCACGQGFDIPDTQIGSHVVCPQCQRALVPLSATPAAAGATPVQATKACPFCGETILAVARKCRFCNEFLDRGPLGPAGTASATAGQTASGDDPEPPVFTLSVSQWDNFFRYLICATVVAVAGALLFYLLPLIFPTIPYGTPIFLGVVLIAALACYIYYLGARNARCIIRPSRIQTESGIFSRQVDSLEMFRIRDLELQKRNLFQRLLGIGSITLWSTDVTSPQLELYQIPQVRKVFEYLQTQVPKADKEHGSIHIQQ